MIKFVYILILIFNCASQGTPRGGPADVDGPILLDVTPISKSNIIDSQKIILTFNERINPASIINSISINPKIDIIKKVKRNKIIIKPLNRWIENQTIEINLNRNISDFYTNNVNKDIQLIFNIQSDNYCSITGDLFNARKDKFYNIYIYEWPVNILDNPIKKVNADNNYHFEVNYLKSGKYVAVASEGDLDIYNNYYGISSVEYISLDENNCNENIVIYIDEPLIKIKITRVETVNSDLLNIFYDNNEIEAYIIDSNTNVGDSICIEIIKTNRLHKYEIEPYLYFVKSKIDTISPWISSVDDFDSTVVVNFSEPINQDDLFIMVMQNNDWIQTRYSSLSSMSIQLENNDFSRIKFFGYSIEDFSKNKMLDSVKVYNINSKIVNKGTSLLTGKIINGIEKNIIVEAKNISLNLSYTYVVEDSSFKFKNLSTGEYVFRAYEQKNEINPLIYFSGTLNPYQRAAQFSIYKDTIEVRRFWDIEDINIEF